MRREIIWAPLNEPGLEHLRLADEAGVDADGLVIGYEAGRVFRARYRVRCDPAWRLREVSVVVMEDGQPSLHLLTDGSGGWKTGDGAPLPALDGCRDVDLTATPFTNTLPIRRLEWQPGVPAEVVVAYVELPSLRLTAQRQRYTLLEAPPLGRRFRFEVPEIDFAAILTVDPDGLVVDYPGLFRRAWST